MDLRCGIAGKSVPVGICVLLLLLLWGLGFGVWGFGKSAKVEEDSSSCTSGCVPRQQ
jgi:hypothetical protein